MKNFIKCCIVLIIILFISLVTLVGIGFFMTANETNINNFKSITLADGTTIGIPADFTITKPFGDYIDNDGFYYANCDLKSKDYGWIHIEYTHDPVETMTHGQNSTKAVSNNGIYEYDVFDSDGHRVMKITGSNPSVVKAIGETVKFNMSKSTNKTVDNTTTIKEETNNNQQNNNQQSQQGDSADRAGTLNEENKQTTYIGKDGKTHTMEEAYSVDYSSGDLNIINEQRRARGMSSISA